MKTFTLDLNNRVCSSCQQLEKSGEVDYTSDGFIVEIRVWSEFFKAYVPVSELYLKANYESKLELIRSKIAQKLEDAAFTPKQHNNDDAEIA